MSRRAVADILRDHGAAWREANRGHVSLGQLAAVRRRSEVTLRAVRTRAAATLSSATTVAATAIARSARVPRPVSGWPHARPSCYPSAISMSSIRCQPGCATWPIRTSA